MPDDLTATSLEMRFVRQKHDGGFLLGTSLLASAAHATPEDEFVAHPRINPTSAAEVTAACDAYLAKALSLQTTLEHEAGAATAGTLRAYDALFLVLEAGSSDAGLVAEVAPDDARRDAARACAARFGEPRLATPASGDIMIRSSPPTAGRCCSATDVDR